MTKSNHFYSNQANVKYDPTTIAGRPNTCEGSEDYIFRDIKIKLALDRSDTVLDIGCGGGTGIIIGIVIL